MTVVKNSGVALVTGASRGIGATIARRLAREGFAVALNYASSSAEANKLVAELSQAGVKAIAVQGDVSRADDVRRMFETVERQLGKIDVLVNNAGILKTVPLAQTTDELFAQTFAINVGGVFNTLREAATRINDGGRHQGRGRSFLARIREGIAWAPYHGELRGAGAGGNRPVPERQDRRTDPAVLEDAAAGAPGPAGRYRECGGVPRRPGWCMG